VDVAVADPNGKRTQQNLAWSGLRDLDVLDFERLALLVQNCCFHVDSDH
jgi:hypothetical protein